MNMRAEGGNQVPGCGSSPASQGMQPRRRPCDDRGGRCWRNTDRGWTVFQIPSTPSTLLAVGLDSYGPDRARTRSSFSGRRARARDREVDAASAMAEGFGGGRRARWPRTRGTSPPLPSRTALARSGLGSRPWGAQPAPATDSAPCIRGCSRSPWSDCSKGKRGGAAATTTTVLWPSFERTSSTSASALHVKACALAAASRLAGVRPAGTPLSHRVPWRRSAGATV